MKRVVARSVIRKVRALYWALLLVPAVKIHATMAASGHAEAAADVAEHHESSGGLPQLNPASFPSQIFWLAITFLVMYLVFSRKALPEISSVIENRQEHIQSDLNAAEDLKDESEKVHNAYEEILEESRNKASELFATVEDKIKAEATAALDGFRERSNSASQDAEQRIAEATKAAMKDMDQIAAEVASQAAEKIVGISTDIDRAKSVIDNINKKAA